MTTNLIQSIFPIENQWQTKDPFLFCAYHYDLYPGGNGTYGPATSIAGRMIGQDFSGKDGWSMYHGKYVPGFPSHPHRGFETVSVVKKGFMDHSDSLGGIGRFGGGDTQWLTSGKGIQHSEMFPLLNKDSNPLELFQIWLNLPKRSKFVEPHYKMFWKEKIPVYTNTDDKGNKTIIDIIAGKVDHISAISPAPDSWAANPENEVEIWTMKMDANASFEIPATIYSISRALYFYDGDSISIEDTIINSKNGIDLNSTQDLKITNGNSEGYFLLLQGKPINEPKAQYGPFVMNTDQEIQDAMTDYQRTQFGGWPHSNPGPVHGERGRFAKYADGTEEIID